MVTEILAEIGPKLVDLQEVTRAIDRARDQHSLAPAAWVTVERTVLGLRSRHLSSVGPRDRWLPRVVDGLEADA